MKDHYVKDYKEKELRQFILAYLLITVASIALHTDFSADNADLLDTLLKMAAMGYLGQRAQRSGCDPERDMARCDEDENRVWQYAE